MDDRMSMGSNGSQMAERLTEAANYTMQQATDTMERLRSVIDQATHTMRDLSQISGEWAGTAQVRAREMASQVRSQGEWAANTVSRQVEEYPLTSLVVAFGVGYLCGMMIRR